LNLAQSYPGSNGLIARDTYPNLNDTIRKEFFKWCPDGWIKRKPTKDDNTCILKNGTTINFRYLAQKGKSLSDGTTQINVLGATYDWAIVDQIESPAIVQKDMDDLLGRLRGNTAYTGEDHTMPSTGPRWLVLTCNPTGNWFYKEVVLPLLNWRKRGVVSESLMVDPRTQLPMVDLFEGSTYTNADVLAPDFIVGLEAKYRGQMRERYIMGRWAAFEGLVYPEFSEEIHTVPRGKLLDYLTEIAQINHVVLRSFECYDFGLASPSCYLFGLIDHFGRVLVIDGFHRREFAWDLQGPEIKRIRNKYAALVDLVDAPIVADPDIFKRKTVAGHKITTDSIAKLFRSRFDLKFKPGDNDIENGIARVTGYLNSQDRTPHLFLEDLPGPMIYFATELEFVSDEFTNYFWQRNPQGLAIDRPLDRNDHAMDAIKYGLSKLPDPSEIIIPLSEREPLWKQWHEVDDYSLS
jgi:hypothetical protein